jgi:cytoskeletal protein CcmA (bactofilin family)
MRKVNEKKGIVSIVAIFSIGLISFSLALALANNTLAATGKNKNFSATNQSFYTAESSAKEGLYQFINEESYTGDTYSSENRISTSYNEAEFFGTHATIVGVAENKTHREIKQELIVFPEGFAFSYAIYAQNDLSLGGSSQVSGNIFANGDICVSGSSVIDGEAAASGGISTVPPCDDDSILEGTEGSAEPIPPPDIDPGEYESAAQDGGTYFNNSNNGEGFVNGNTNTAVVFIDAPTETKIQGDTTHLTGSLVSTGDLSIKGGTFIASDDYATIVVYGDLTIAGGATIEGVVYVVGATSFGAGSNSITGSLISVSGVVTDVTGNTTITYDPELAEGWQDITGLNTTSSEPPKIIWTEE